jgi:N,N'-diacetyllegionaminate synthase
VAADAAAALGHGRKECLAAERDNLIPSRRSLRAAKPLSAGHIVGPGDIAVLRPGVGLPPARVRDLVGARLTRSIDAGAPFLESDLSAQRGQREAA